MQLTGSDNTASVIIAKEGLMQLHSAPWSGMYSIVGRLIELAQMEHARHAADRVGQTQARGCYLKGLQPASQLEWPDAVHLERPEQPGEQYQGLETAVVLAIVAGNPGEYSLLR